jgi:hypothetical protein
MTDRIRERFAFIPAVPVDLAGASGISTPAINLKHALRAALILIKGAGSGAEDPVITLTQGTGINAGALVGGANLAVITNYGTKLNSAGPPATLTEVTQAAGNTITPDGADQGIVVVEITPDQLADGFIAVRATIADVGTTAQLGALLWMVELKHAPAGSFDLQANA